MSDVPLNSTRRRFLTLTTAVVGAIGASTLAVPFLASWNPSAKAKAAGAPVEVDISKIETGQLIRVIWQGKPVWIVKRDPLIIEQLDGIDSQLRDPSSQEPQQPDYITSSYRSIKPEIFVAVGLCTHLGCSPTYLPDTFSDQIAGVQSGFFCPCHGSKFDMAGRVFKSVPAPYNLVIPPYTFLDDNRILVGSDGETS